jgi:hypothetical protein
MKENMKKVAGFFASVLVLVIISFAFSAGVFATKPVNIPNPERKVETKEFSLPPGSKEIAPEIFKVGELLDEHGRIVEGYAIIDYKKSHGKPSESCGNLVCDHGENAKKCPQDCDVDANSSPSASTCYSYLTKDVRWKEREDYIFDSQSSQNLSELFLKANFAYDISKWEDAVDGVIDGQNVDIIGGEVTGYVDGADTSSPDGKNEVYFADINDTDAIAVTIIWGVFQGPPQNRELVEWDQVYDNVDYFWSKDATEEQDKMDFENIATHELGHVFGLKDLYTGDCTEETMYGYAAEGEVKKRDLATGDIEGVGNLYNGI